MLCLYGAHLELGCLLVLRELDDFGQGKRISIDNVSTNILGLDVKEERVAVNSVARIPKILTLN